LANSSFSYFIKSTLYYLSLSEKGTFLKGSEKGLELSDGSGGAVTGSSLGGLYL